MIPIVKERNLPFHQSFGKRRLILLSEATLYNDGKNKLLWLSFKNNFKDTILSVKFELTQFNSDKQVIDKSRVYLDEFICEPYQQQTITSPIVTLSQCEAISVKITNVSFRSLDLIHDVWTPTVHPLTIGRSALSKLQKSGPLKIVNPLGWLFIWTLFWMMVALIIVIATFQYGLI
jgi:hypothetical protein